MNRGFEPEQGKKWVSETGRMLLKEGLVARTWGNISCRTQGGKMIITPSGMGYDNMTENDVVVMDLTTGEWEGDKKPSSEKGIHAGAYEYFEEHSKTYLMHPATKEFILWCIKEANDNGFKVMKRKYTSIKYDEIKAKYPNTIIIPIEQKLLENFNII
jgi:L-ribulose-5-phosphate 4-epimerase